MSFHIRLQKDKSLDFKIAVALYFLNFFKEYIHLLDYRIRSKGEIKHIEDIQSDTNVSHIKKEINENDEAIAIEFFFRFKDKLAYLEINSEYHSRFSDDIEFNISNNSLQNIFMEQQLREQLKMFLKNAYNEHSLVKAYIDVDEEGSDNPLDIIYDYEPRGSNFFIKVIRALEVLSEDSPELLELYEKVRGSDKNYVASRLWQNNLIRSMIFDIADSKGIVAQESSVLFFAEDKGKVKDYYLEIINNILNPIFSDVPSIDKQIENFSEKQLNR